jgi:hypothetical protein
MYGHHASAGLGRKSRCITMIRFIIASTVVALSRCHHEARACVATCAGPQREPYGATDPRRNPSYLYRALNLKVHIDNSTSGWGDQPAPSEAGAARQCGNSDYDAHPPAPRVGHCRLQGNAAHPHGSRSTGRVSARTAAPCARPSGAIRTSATRAPGRVGSHPASPAPVKTSKSGWKSRLGMSFRRQRVPGSKGIHVVPPMCNAAVRQDDN